MRHWNESIPRELEKIILKLLEKDPRKRFQTAKELQDALVKASGKRERGGWLNKGAVEPAPLVHASDPVAWHRGQRRASQIVSLGLGSGSIQPMSLPIGNFSREVRVAAMHTVPETAMGVEREERTSQLHFVYDVADEEAAAKEVQQEFGLGRSRSVVTSYRGLDSAGLETMSDDTEFDDREIQKLLDASSEVSARTQVRMVVAASLILAGVVVVALVCSGVFRPLVLGSNDHLLLTVIQNKTGDKALDATVMQGSRSPCGSRGPSMYLEAQRIARGCGRLKWRAALQRDGSPAAVSHKTLAQERMCTGDQRNAAV